MGRPQFAASGTKAGGDRVAGTDRPDVKEHGVTNTSNLAAGVSESVDIYSPQDTIWRVRGAKLNVNNDADATTGSHQITVLSFGVAMLQGRSNYTNRVTLNKMEWESASQSSRPNSAAAVGQSIRSLRCDFDSALSIRYTNDMDVAQENSRDYNIVIEEASL